MRLFAVSKGKNPYGFSSTVGFLVYSENCAVLAFSLIVFSGEPMGKSTSLQVSFFNWMKLEVRAEGWAASSDRLTFNTLRLPGYRERLLFFRKHLTKLKTAKKRERQK